MSLCRQAATTRFSSTYLEAMAARLHGDRRRSSRPTAREVIGDTGYTVAPTVNARAPQLDRALTGRRLPTEPVTAASQYDWDATADQAETVHCEAASTDLPQWGY